MSEYVYCWRVQAAHELTPQQREKMVRELNSVPGAVQECPAWGAVVTPAPPDDGGPLAHIIFRAATLFESLLQPAFGGDGLLVKTWVHPHGLLKRVILDTYQGERPEMESLPSIFPGDDYFYKNHFWPLYLDSLLLKEADARAYCKRHQYPQVREMKGYMKEEATRPALAQTQQPIDGDVRGARPSETDEKSALSDAELADRAKKWTDWGSSLGSSKGELEMREAARIAAAKIAGKTQVEIHDMLFPHEKRVNTGTKKTRITRYKTLVRKIAKDKGFLFPPQWEDAPPKKSKQGSPSV